MNGFRTLLLGAFAVSAVLAPASAQVGADLNLSPKRVVFKAADRSATVFVYNRGTDTVSYSIDLVDRVMTPDGNIRPVDEAGKDPTAADAISRFHSAKSMLMFTPRRVTLGPNESQTVRVRLLRPSDLAPGEYRSSLTVTAIPPEDAGLTAEKAAEGPKNEVSLRVIALFSLSIPVIVRQGDTVAAAKFASVRLAEKNVMVKLQRSGAGSLYGDIEIHRGDAKGEVVGFVKGLGVYGEVDSREVAVPLTAPVSRGEKLLLLYRDDDQSPGAVLTSETLLVP